jgi:hypothetical protein
MLICYRGVTGGDHGQTTWDEKKGGESAGRCQSTVNVFDLRSLPSLRGHASTARMTLLMDRFQAAMFDMRVDLSRADARMPQHFLECSDVSATSEKMSGEAVPQCVRAHFGSTADSTGIALYQ